MKINKTLKKFGYPNTLIKEYLNWCLLLRNEQVTLGSLVLICKDDVEKFSEISSQAFKEYEKIIRDIEKNLHQKFKYDKINYLMLMMVDPNVHFHIFPRFSDDKKYLNFTFIDNGWPATPDFSKINNCGDDCFNYLKEDLKNQFA